MQRKTTTLWQRGTATLLGAIVLVALADTTARADEADYRQLTLTLNAPYLLLPVFELNAELALRQNWSVAVRGGGGQSDLGGRSDTILEFGAQTAYYVLGRASRGVQLGLDARAVRFENDGQLMGLGDGVAVGPFVGYKRTFGSGFTLAAQLGVQVALSGNYESRALPYFALNAGWAFLPVVRPPPDGPLSVSAAPGSRPQPPSSTNPFDYHAGFMFGVGLAGGTASIVGCDGCKLEPGLAVNAYLGWFVHPRVAVMLDSNALVALFSLSSGFGSFGFGLTGPAVQYWPHKDVWLKFGLGVAEVSSTALGGTGLAFDIGGGMTVAAGYQLHHDRNFSIDAQLRATHGDFGGNDKFDAVDSYVALLGFNWY